MRFRDYPAAGRPAALTAQLEELLVLTYGAIETSNVERWALSFGAAVPPNLPGTLRRNSYETDVVGSIHRLGQRYWERRDEAAVWERPFPTGQAGRPPAVDIALFSAAAARETRIEFGLCSVTAAGRPTRSKLVEDADKLAGLSTRIEPGYENVDNYVVLWHHFRGPGQPLTAARRRDFRRLLSQHAAEATEQHEGLSVELLTVSGGHLFGHEVGFHHWVGIGLFKVVTVAAD